MKRWFRLLALMYVVGWFVDVSADNKQLIKIAYIAQEIKVPAALSNLDEFIQYQGEKGAEIAITDNNTTGQFTQQQYQLKKILVPLGQDIVTTFKEQVGADVAFVVTNIPDSSLVQLVESDQAKKKLFFDASSINDGLRNQLCMDNVLHMLPSRAMRADALAQYMLKKRWKEWFLVIGSSAEDALFAKSLKRAAKRFGLKIVAEKKWLHSYDARRTAQADVPVFTQGVDYDVLVVADEQGLFGEYLDYRTWIPRPVIGTQGLVATSWHRTHEQWGAVQIQNRFKELSGRWMDEQDYGAYLAVRAIGEASVRTHTNDMQKIRDYLLDEKFALQGYKGKPLTFRAWNGQLRQPVLLAAARSLVGVAPVEGFLHPVSELDTLGFDRSESECHGDSKGNETVLPVAENADQQQESIENLKKIFQDFINKIKQKMDGENDQ